MSYLRTKALFQIVLLLTTLFTVSLVAPLPVAAREDACCERTTSGDSCVYTARRDCDLNYNTAYTTCDQTTYCKPVCCVDTQSGVCYKQVSASTCNQRGGTPLPNSPNCDAQQCRSGCCQIGNQCSLQTEKSCQKLTSRYPTLQGQDTFDESITNEFACILQCRQDEEGCCVQGEQCTYTTRGQCSGDFKLNKFCSDSSLPCGVRAQDHKACVEDSDDVYWFDSAGNKEGIAEDCDYTQGTKCGLVNNQAVCKSLDCADTQDFPTTNIHDSQMGKFRHNGDSWCVYESGVGEFRDRPGSRHYRHLCINGEEIIEPCRDFREQICLQGKVTVAGKEHTNSQCINNEVYDSLVIENISSVQRGFKFWESVGGETDRGTPKREGSELCAQANVKCTAVWLKKNNFDDWECESNCFCETQQFIDDAAWYCRSKGDCGATVNILGKKSDAGFIVAWDHERGGQKPDKVSENYWTNMSRYGVFGGMKYLQESFQFVLASVDYTSLEEASIALAVALVGYAAVTLALETTAVTTALSSLGITLSTSLINGIVGVVVGAILIYYGIEHGDVATTGAGSILLVGGVLALVFPVIGWIIGLIAAAVAVIWTLIVGGAKIEKNKATITCEPWVPPRGGQDCEKCDDDPSKECTDYRCRSLGAACKYLAEDQSCANSSPNDVTSPVISPWPEILSQGFTLSETRGSGYAIQPAVPIFTPITFGIKTGELSQCKISDQHTPTFDAMTQPFGSSSFKKEHKITVTLSPGRDYTYYVRCADVNDNKNTREYFIQLQTSQQPDITPPQILSTSLRDGAFIKSGATETSFVLYLHEPGSCRWSTQDQNYNSMPAAQSFLCEDTANQDPLHQHEYLCGTQLKGIQDNTKTQYYFRCKDLNNNEQQQSTLLSLQGTSSLQIISVTPQGDVLTNSPTLQVTTAAGAEQGKASCTYEHEGFRSIPFFTTGGNQHSQTFEQLPQASYTYTIICSDAAANTAEQTITFSVTVDNHPPSITQIYSDDQTLYVLTNEASSCSYSTTSSTFAREQGIAMTGDNTQEHTLPLDHLIYYILCWDNQNNIVGPVTVIA